VQKYSYLILLFALFIVPQVLRPLRIPTAITSFALGVLCALGLDIFRADPTVELLSTLGIVSLFLFAGLDVELRELRQHATVLVQHLAIQVLSLVLLAAAAVWLLQLPVRSATLVALGLLTPSTGFILDSLNGSGLPERARFWIKSKAIATELVALAILFVLLQSDSAGGLTISALILLAMVVLVPVLFRVFATVALPYAPKTEFAFLLIMAVACGVGTYELGVYYLVGAFVVGMGAQRLRKHLTAAASEKMIGSVESFASLFVPFYFFNAGTTLRQEDFGPGALGLGLLFSVIGITFRLVPTWLHRRVVFGESLRMSMEVATPMLPTLVFTLVIAGILRERFDIGPELFGGLVVYAIVNSLVPGFVFKRQLPEVEEELTQRQHGAGLSA